MTRILAVGGAHVDRRGRIEGPTRPGASNPGSWFDEAGGGTFNAARNLAGLGHAVVLVSPRGGDAEGESVARAAAQAGITDKPLTFLDRKTPSYTAILEEDGNLVLGFADMELYRLMVPRRLTTRQFRAELDQAEWVVTDANLPADTLSVLARTCTERGIPLAAIAISPAKVVRFAAALPHLSALFMNEAEAAALLGNGEPVHHPADWPLRLRALGLKAGAVSRGKLGAIAFDEAGQWMLAPNPVEVIGDVTGAGDGLAAGIIDGMMRGLPLAESLRQGTALAGLTVRSPHVTLESLDPVLLAGETGLVPLPVPLA